MNTTTTTATAIRPAPSYASVWATLTRQERIEIRSLIDRASRCQLTLAHEDAWNILDPTDGEVVGWDRLAKQAWQAQAQAHSLWRAHGFADLPTYQIRSLVD